MTPVAMASTIVTRFDVAPAWRQTLPVLLLLWVLTLGLYHQTGLAMVTIWSRSDTFAHAFLVPPIAAWLVWRQRLALMALTPQPAVAPLVFVLLAAFVWLLADLAAVASVSQLAFMALLVLAVPSVLGWAVARAIMFPLGFLFFAVPLGEFLLPQFMAWTADVTVFALRMSGIPVYREGMNFVIPSGNWSVVEACSGVRYLIASVTVGTLFAYLNYQSLKRRILFVIVALLVPVLANWMRAYLIVMLGHLSGNQLAAGFDHLIYGWLFFGVVILLMFFVGTHWAEPEFVPSASDASQSVSVPALPVRSLWRITVGFAALVALPYLVLLAHDRGGAQASVALVVPENLNGWRRLDSDSPSLIPSFHNASAQINDTYTRQGRAVGLYIGYYRDQDFNRKLVSSSNVLVSRKDPQWVQVTSDHRPAAFANQTVEVRKTELRSLSPVTQVTPDSLVVWQIYWVNGSLTASDSLAKVYGAFYRLTGQGDDAAVIVISTPKDPSDSAGADAVLHDFLKTNSGAIHDVLLAAMNKT